MQVLTFRGPDSGRVDKLVLWAILLLSAFGIVAVYSAIGFLAETKGGGDTEALLFKHMFRVGLAIVAMGIFSVINYRALAKISRFLLIVSIGLLWAVQVVGVISGGAARWLNLAGVMFQPSDLAKVSLLLFVAMLLTQKQAYIKSFSRSFAPIFLWIMLTIASIGISDLSTSAVVLTAVMIMCFVARVSVLQIMMVGLLGLTLAYGMLLTSPQRAARLEAYVGVKMFPNTDAESVFSSSAEQYQSEQAKMAIAQGGLFGVGPGKSIQRDFLPAPYNDFIFAIIAEEYGLLGAMAVLGLYLIILFRGLLRIARKAPDPLGLFLAVGIVVMLTLYGFVHAGVSSNLLPVTGLPLPFVSYGGTSLLANGVMAGILLNISRQVDAQG
ncbi:MAG: putative peptidoglycan glycosyltransferase FtsW [Bacteroidetes bacterium]|nr:putative peptidoglycan glycosyltransferase FtsW [Bacteroidota bacterium]MDA0874484.1 putative peptidoglycan glycosyltransferase FtsW [Bacteroidota bacterium]